MTNTHHAVAVLSSTVDGNAPILTFQSESGDTFEIRLDSGIIPAVVATLVDMGMKLSTAGKGGITAQPLSLTGILPALSPQGQPVLDLVAEGGMHFPVTFPKSAIDVMENALALLRERAK